VTFGSGSGAASGGGTKVVATANTSDDGTVTVPDEPAATTGIELDDDALAGLLAGEPVTITVDGFTPGSKVTVVIYSTPTVLGTVTADATGAASWTGSRPASLSGQHTLVFMSGDIAKGIVLTLPERSSIEGMCLVDPASLTWGFKESFLAYIDSTIANGTWTVDGVEDNAGIFTWSAGTGAVDPATGVGSVTFNGSVEFTGHDGALDTTIANPVVELNADGAYLVLDVSGVTQDGKSVSATGVRFAALDLAEVTPTVEGDTVTFTDVPATLTDEGSAAFGTYPSGEQLDPVTLTATGADGCLAALAGGAAPTEQPTASASPEPSAGPAEAGGVAQPSSGSSWVWWALTAIVVAAIAVTIVLARRRRDTMA
jgi:hypothetical protein